VKAAVVVVIITMALPIWGWQKMKEKICKVLNFTTKYRTSNTLVKRTLGQVGAKHCRSG
jgi:hypothetical protein